MLILPSGRRRVCLKVGPGMLLIDGAAPALEPTSNKETTNESCHENEL